MDQSVTYLLIKYSIIAEPEPEQLTPEGDSASLQEAPDTKPPVPVEVRGRGTEWGKTEGGYSVFVKLCVAFLYLCTLTQSQIFINK